MEEGQPVWHYALDLDIILALAQKRDYALTFIDCCREKEFRLAVSPTVIQELNYASSHSDGWAKKHVENALKDLRQWCTPFDLKSVGHGLTEEFAMQLVRKGLIPEEEKNSGLILAEVAFARIPVLVSGSRTLLSISRAKLQECCDQFDHPLCVKVQWPANLVTEWGYTFVN